MGVQMSTSEVSSDDDEPDDRRRRRSDSSEDSEDDEDNDNLTYYQRRMINQPSLKRVARMSTIGSGTSPQYETPPSRKQHQPPPLRKQQHQPLPSQHVSLPLNAVSVTADVEAENTKKLLEWELSALEADDLRSHAWYHGQQVDRTEAERLLRQCVAEEHGFATTTATKCSSPLQQHVEEDTSDSDGMDDISSESSDADFAIDDCLDERGMIPDPSLAMSTTMAAKLLLEQRRRIDGGLSLKRPKRPHRPRRQFYCFLVRDSQNVRPPGRYVVSCLRVDKYEDLEIGDKNKSQRCHDDEQRRKFRRKQQRRQRRQHRHPVLHFVVNEIILQPGTVYERSQFSFGETLPSMATAISTAAVNNNGQRQYQPGFDSVPDLIRYYVGGSDDNAVLSYGGGNDGVVSGSTTLSRTAQTEVRIRYPCNRRRPLMTDNALAEAASSNILPSTMENSRLVRQRCRTLTTASVRTEGLRELSTSSGGETETSTSSQNTNHRQHSPSPPPQISKWMREQSSSRSSIRKTPSATVTSAMVTSDTSVQPSSAVGSANKNRSQPLTLSPCPPRIDPQSSITASTSRSPGPSVTTLPRLSRSPKDLLKTFPSRCKPEMASTSMGSSIKTLPRQPKSSYPIPSTSGSSSSLSYERSSTSGSSSNSDQSSSSLRRTPSYPGMPTSSTPHFTISDLLSSPPSSTGSSRPSRGISRVNSLNRGLNEPPFNVFSITAMGTNEGVARPAINIDSPEVPASVRDMFNEHAVDLFSLPFETAVRSSFIRIRLRNDFRSMLNRRSRQQHLSQPGSSGSFPSTSRSGSYSHRSDDSQSRPASRRIRTERRRVPSNRQIISSSSENENDDEEQEQQQSSSSESSDSSISTSTLMDEEVERNRDGNRQLFDRQRVESGVHQSQQNEFQCTGRWIVNNQRETQDEEVQEVENPMQNVEVKHKNVKEKHTRLNDRVNTKVNQKQSDEQTTSDSDSNFENSSEASENQNFQKCRARQTNTMRQGLVDMLEQPHLDHQTQITETQDCDPRQRRSRQMHQTLNEDQEVNHTTDSMETELHRSIPDTETRHLAMLTNRTDQEATVTPTQTPDTWSSIRLVDDGLAENMIRQYHGLQTISNRSRNAEVIVIHNRITLSDILRRNMRQLNRLVTASENHQLPTGGNLPSAGEYLTEHVIPPGETKLQVNQEGSGALVTKAGQSNTTAVESSSGQEIGTCSVGVGSIGYRLACDYVNINPQIDDHNSSFDKSGTQHLNTNNFDKIHHKNYKHQGSKQQSNNYNNFVDNNIEAGADYENIISRNTDDINDFNYENIGQNSDKKRQQLINDFNGGSTAVAAALRAVHLAIIGDPDDSSGASVGTGRLAAALCRADGWVTVLPYRRNFTESEQVGPFLSTCPLQLLGQPGPAGRRARLDVIERFACLQYLVAMTVIVTPCLLLIGSDINDKENLADENLEWSLEDEYEYRRRRFYYRCAGISSWCVADNNSTSDDDDESYKLTANSDFDSGYSLPPREEWAVEKRHWLDLLTRHRAAALDKWIRTAADAKQAVGDVFGYRALMSALCSDRIQALQDAWATLRRVHTATAVAFESRLRPEFLGRREKNVVAVLGKPGINDIDDNDMNDILQLPPNATVPDATALAVLYEHLYNDNNSDTSGDINTTTASFNDIGSKKEKDPRLSSFFTSPLLLSPSPWSSLNSGISGGLGSSVASDYGLSALHLQCIQYSEWVQQSYSSDDPTLPLAKPPMLQLDRFRSNFRTLLRQYSRSGFDGYDEDDESFVLSNKDKNISYHEEFKYNENENFAYERQYEDNVEEYGTSGADYDDCGDDDDDDATVICCNNRSSLSAVRSVAVDAMCGDSHVAATAAEKQRQTTTKNEQCHRPKQDQEEDRYYRWIEDVSANSPGPAPLNIVFCTELHVRLFWPPTLFLQDINDNKDTVDHKLAIPAYALGTTYTATATAAYNNESESSNHVPPALVINHVINAQLDQAAQDMRLRYKAMDDFLDRACSYSTLVAKIAYEDNTMVDKQQQNCMLSQCV